MNKKLTRLILLLSLLLVFIPSVQADDGDATLYVIHGIPGADLGLDPLLPVDVMIDDTLCVLQDFEFQSISEPLLLAEGTYNIKIKQANLEAPCTKPHIIEADIALIADENATVIAHLTEDGLPAASKFVNDLSAAPSGQARAVARHTAAAPAVDITLENIDTLQELVIADLVNPGAAQAHVDTGNWQVSIAPAGTSTPLLGPLDLILDPDTAYMAHAVGSADTGSLTLILHTLPMEELDLGPFKLSVIHGIPGDDLGLDPTLPVDVLVNDTICLLEGFEFGEIAKFKLSAGTYNIKIGPANSLDPCTETPVIEADVPFTAGENATVIAHLTENGLPTASKFVNDLSPTAQGDARLVVRHTAAAPAVDITACYGYACEPKLVIGDLGNPDEVQADVPAGKYKVSIAPAGEDPVFGPVRVKLRSSVAHYVYAVGSLDSGSFTLIKQRIWHLE